MTKLMRGARGAVLAAATLAAAGCSQLGALGTLGNVLGGVMGQQGNSGEVYGEVRYVDTQRQTIQIETSNGQVGNVYFDQRTRVVYQQQEYPVTALERGDQVAMRIRQDQRGTAYTDYISVTQSVQERGGSGGSTSGSTYGMQSLEGRVNWVDYNRGEFSVNTSRGQVVVFLRYNASGYEADRFRQLRQGSYVRLQGRYVSQNRFELDRFS